MSLNSHALAIAILAWMSSDACAEQVSLFQSAMFSGDRQPLIEAKQPAPDAPAPAGAASLFIGQAGASLFAPYPVRQRRLGGAALLSGPASQLARVRQLIGQAEAGRQGYDAIQHGAKIRPVKRPTAMTIQEIYDWIAFTPGQQHAIGRYQFIPKTLARLVDKLGLGHNVVFSPQVQDQLGDALLVEAGLNAFRAGNIDRQAFMNNMAAIWAGLPTSSGKSHYDGFAGNKATMSWARFQAEMAEIFPG